MDNININTQDVIFALDIGTRSVIGTAGIVKDKKFHVVAEYSIEHEERSMIDGQIHDIGLVAAAVNNVKKKLEESLNMKMEKVAIAAAGRFLRTVISKAELKLDYDREIDNDTVRSLELTAVKAAEEEINDQSEGKLYCVGYSVRNYFLNGYIINNLLAHKGEIISAEIIATFLPRSVVDSLYAVMNKVGLQVASLTLEPIAAMEAAIPKNLRLLNIALVDIGAGTSDIAISSKDSISAYGMVPIAGDEITETIAQSYLVDFNTAENIKKDCTNKEIISYVDVLGLENEITSEEVIKLITPVVRKIAEEIGATVIRLNGDKSPNAIFLVGGGAHTPMLKEFLAEKLNIPIQRIGIRGRDAVVDCVCQDNSMGSIGVTVLGIALISIKRLGHDFIDVTVNGTVISLFNSHKHTVMDVMMQAGVDPKILIGKNGRNMRFNLNGIKRVAFGSLASNAEIFINGVAKSIDEEVKEGDTINIIYAKAGKDASPKIKDYVKKLYSVSFFINDIIENLEPIGIINGKKAGIEDDIREGDEVQIIFPETLGDYKKYYTDNSLDYKYFLDGVELSDNYVIKDENRIYRIKNEESERVDGSLKEEIVEKGKEDNNFSSSTESYNIDNDKDTISEVSSREYIDLELDKNNSEEIEIIVNDKSITLKGKKEYIFVDIFNYIEFDLTVPKGNLYLRLNGNSVGYYDSLKNGDQIELGWE
ncbi:cell division FtsA domain-containing protein [Clostridium sp. A1-XYC3]|uniref:Cell division FtsA domain-containing protein n=1 Tax=Clostridium tanneri TaxID=3037988 RepID=A0ABU4JXP0_9CLOT|nr:cell division FtsA domain-containing protein [Clostridium sp. A1-XYC3]MDW8802944.1 cell division FtsA domain-containing protein [Clostridium sp. A1-XYC3]